MPFLAPVLLGLKVAVNEQVPFTATFTPLHMPLIVNGPVLLKVPRLRSDVPALVIVRVSALLLVPTRWMPKSCEVLLSDSTGSTPVPCRPTVSGDPLALLGTVIDPDFAPEVTGAKLAVKTQVPPGLIAMLLQALLTVNPLVAPTVPTVTVPVPVLRIVTDCPVLVVPTR